MQAYTAIVQQADGWWIGWIQEVPGTNAQEKTRDELIESLREVLRDMLELNRVRSLEGVVGDYETVSLVA